MSDTNAASAAEVAKVIRSAMFERSLMLKQVAAMTEVNERTLGRILNGSHEPRPDTAAKILKALNPSAPAAYADERHGGYALSNFAHYLGYYRAYRWAFSEEGRAFRTVYRFDWSKEARCMVFHERNVGRDKNGHVADYSQSGEIFIGPSTGHVDLVTIASGSVRLIKLSQLMTHVDCTMRGFVLTLRRRAATHLPAVSPLVLEQVGSDMSEEEIAAAVGLVPAGAETQRVLALLRETEDDYGNLSLTPRGGADTH
ncbi:MAG: helix-turn-helix domain-containing protein [Alphaproteobacteria bacterium]|nr:helix-turn-helix domain-containing protein [Alphaproteobacteria bacterium]